MKISCNWLKQYLVFDLPVPQLCSLLTDIGLEVEYYQEYQNFSPGLEHIILGEVVLCVTHPNSETLQVIDIKISQKEVVKIVCKTSYNILIGQKVFITQSGGSIIDINGKKERLKTRNIRGIDSEGIIYLDHELALKVETSDILLKKDEFPIGTSLLTFFQQKKDYIIDIGLTPNRIDAIGHWGIARDLYAALKTRGHKSELHKPEIKDFTCKKTRSNLSVYVEDPTQCIRYSGCLILDIKVAASPIWLQTRLRSININPINNIVDITNFVMHELGHPIHAFDADDIEGKAIHVKNLKKGEFFITVDGKHCTLSDDDLMIFDAKKPLSIAGIVCGLDSKITPITKNIFLESTCLDPIIIRNSSKRHGLKTDSSFRFERGTDPEQVLYALKRAALLIQKISGGTICVPIDFYPNPIQPTPVKLRYEKINCLLGETLSRDTIKKILFLLEIDILLEENDSLLVSIPSYRMDVLREVDLIEEILRIYGYNLIKTPEKFSFSIKEEGISQLEVLQDHLSTLLTSQGFYEVITLSLIDRKYKNFIQDESVSSIEVLNPLSEELAILRQSLLFGLMERITYNVDRKQNRLKFFEWGKTYNKKRGQYIESNSLALIMTASHQKLHWLKSKDLFSYFELKGIIESCLENNYLNKRPRQKIVENAFLDQNLYFLYQNQALACIGRVKTSILNYFDLDQEVYYAEIYWESLMKIFKNTKTHIQEVSKYPGAKRDLSILLDEHITFEEVYERIQEIKEDLLTSIHLLDVYQGGILPQGKKSYTLSFHLLDPNKTLTELRIEQVMKNIRNTLYQTVGADFR